MLPRIVIPCFILKDYTQDCNPVMQLLLLSCRFLFSHTAVHVTAFLRHSTCHHLSCRFLLAHTASHHFSCRFLFSHSTFIILPTPSAANAGTFLPFFLTIGILAIVYSFLIYDKTTRTNVLVLLPRL